MTVLFISVKLVFHLEGACKKR